MSAYYNEHDPFAAAWLRELIKADLIPDGEVDERDIRQVQATDVRGFTACHFFAGIGGWPYAIGLAGWPDDRPVWTGSCPCQPFSAAGKRGGYADSRDLWPVWFRLIAECRPATIIGEQVSGKAGLNWLDLVYDDLESCGYAVAACDLPAASVGAPHIRQRLYFVAYAEGQQPDNLHAEPHRWATSVVGDHGETGLVADRHGSRRRAGRAGQAGDGRHTPREQLAGLCAAGELGHANTAGPQGRIVRLGECASQRPLGQAGDLSSMGDSDCPEWRATTEERGDDQHGPDAGRQEAPSG